ncbi:MAG: bifunctional glutamate N-acetyltransferase/amino-acid acetyltransferase ArgJ [Oscillospiraceae bacterium]|nr:bifunctional glutamate N-acetyltransferase/amino-acid acetyltransferase ArgJ [Oscillospiraceae bacterium]
MAYEAISGGVTAAKGFRAAGLHCGIRGNSEKKDLALISSDVECTAAAVYTQNLVQGAPIAVTRQHLANGKARAILCNSGNANTCNADGEEKARKMCALIAKPLGVSPDDVIVASTGVIGQILPLEPIASHVDALADSLSPEGSHDAAEAIMTTDTVPKEVAVTLELGGKTVIIGGIAKGSGMIHPNMATMLSFLTTDAAISAPMLQKALNAAVAESFNMLSVDGDTSTNDMLCIMASGLAGNGEITEENDDFAAFTAALTQMCISLARIMAKDGEGATKLIECSVTGAPTVESARKIAKSVICSSLVKTAMFGEDANWGRILCAIGYAGEQINIHGVDVSICSKAGQLDVCKNGAGIPFSEEFAKVVLAESDIEVVVTLQDGESAARAFGCDLTYDYVKINGDYRT